MNHFDGFNQLLDNRYSCREFSGEIVDEDTINKIIKSAQKVPSWCNSQPWQVTLLKPDTISLLSEKLLEHDNNTDWEDADIKFPEYYRGIYKIRRAICGSQLYKSLGIGRSDKELYTKHFLNNYRFYGAPNVAIVTTPKDLGTYGAVDCGSFITAFTLAATSLGVASIPQAAIAGRSPIVREVLNISEQQNIVCAISFGYEVDSPVNKFRTERASFKEFVKWK